MSKAAKRALIATALAFSWISGCADKPAPTAAFQFPQSPDGALQALAAEDRASFADWQSRLEKTCEVQEVFGDPATPLETRTRNASRGIDLNVLENRLGTTSLLRRNGAMVFFGKPSFDGGKRLSRIARSATRNAGYSALNTEFILEDGTCTVKVFGQKVYETEIATNIPVIASWFPGNKNRKPIVSRPVVQKAISGSWGSVQTHGLDLALWEDMRATDQTWQLLVSELQWQTSSVKRYFSDASGNPIPYTASLADSKSAVPFGSADRRIIGEATDLESVFSRQPRDIRVQFRLAETPFLVTIRQVPAASLSSDSDFENSVVSVEAVKDTPVTVADVLPCLVSRWEALRKVDMSDAENQAYPSYSSVVSFCNPTGMDLNQAWVSDPQARAIVGASLEGLMPDSKAGYAGWDEQAGAMIRLLLEKGSSTSAILETLDPSKRAPLIQLMIAQLSGMYADLRSRDVAPKFKTALMDAATHWAMSGYVVPDSRRALILDAVFKVPGGLEDSALNLVGKLSSDPFGNQDAIDFVEKIDPAYQASLAKLIGLGDKVSAVKGSISSHLLFPALEKRMSAADLEAKYQLLSQIIALAKQDTNATVNSGVDTAPWMSQMVEQVLSEDWSGEDWNSFVQMLALVPDAPGCWSGTSAVSRLQCSGLRISKSTGGLLSSDFDGRYVRASRDLTDLVSALANAERISLADTLKKSFFGPIWANCGNRRFNSRMKDLKDSAQDLIRESDWQKKLDIERRILDSLGDC